MEEIAATFTAAGLPGGFHEAAADVFARSPRPTGPAPDDVLASVVATLLRPPAG
jgi:hypothetical protein